MRKGQFLTLCGAFAGALVLGPAGCGDDDGDGGAGTGGAGTGGGGGAGTGGIDGGVGGTGGGGGAGTGGTGGISGAGGTGGVMDAGTDGGMMPTCADYCAVYATNCTTGDNEYPIMGTSCMQYCETAAALPLGDEGDTSGNSVSCRTYHAGAAADNATLHCPHAGPSGADTCGTWCENYCHLVLKNCTGDNEVFSDLNGCMNACENVPDDGDAGDTTGNTVQCRIYHAGAPAAADPGLHCPHAGGEAPCS